MSLRISSSTHGTTTQPVFAARPRQTRLDQLERAGSPGMQRGSAARELVASLAASTILGAAVAVFTDATVGLLAGAGMFALCLRGQSTWGDPRGERPMGEPKRVPGSPRHARRVDVIDHDGVLEIVPKVWENARWTASKVYHDLEKYLPAGYPIEPYVSERCFVGGADREILEASIRQAAPNPRLATFVILAQTTPDRFSVFVVPRNQVVRMAYHADTRSLVLGSGPHIAEAAIRRIAVHGYRT